MALFDTVYTSCPKCGETIKVSSYNYDAYMREFVLGHDKDVPPGVIAGTDGEDCSCGGCGAKFISKARCYMKLVEVK